MTVYFLDSSRKERNWENCDAVQLIADNISKIASIDSVLIHGTDWKKWFDRGCNKDALLGILCNKGFGTQEDTTNCEVVFFSGDSEKLINNEANITKQLLDYGHIGNIFFVPYNVNDASQTFGGFIKEKEHNENICAKDYLTYERESLEVAFKLLLQGYLLGTLSIDLIPEKLRDISNRIRDNKANYDIFSYEYWQPVCSYNGSLDKRLKSFLGNENLLFLFTHNYKEKIDQEEKCINNLASWLNNQFNNQ